MFSRNLTRRAFSQATLASATRPGTNYTVRNQLFINGKWTDAKDGKTVDTINPGTGEFITKVACGGPDDIDAAVVAAKASGRAWASTSSFERNRIMIKFAQKVEQHADELATLECEDNGKPFSDAMGDVMFSA